MEFKKATNKDREVVWSTHTLSDFELFNETELLPFRPESFPDELFTSWLSRLARANSTQYSNLLYVVTDSNYKNKNQIRYSQRDLDRTCPTKLIDILSKQTGLSKTTIENLTLKSYQQQLPDLWLCGNRSKKIGGLRFCPFCLKDNKILYYRKSWMLKFVTCCPIHKVLLHNRCPNPSCNRPLRITLISYERPSKICPYCETNLSDAPTTTLQGNDPYLNIQKAFISISNKGKTDILDGILSDSFHFFEALYQIALFVIRVFPLDSPIYREHHLTFAEKYKKKWEFLKRGNNVFDDIEASHLVLKVAYSLIQEFPTRLKKLISDYQTVFNILTGYWCAELLKPFRIAKMDKPITKKRISNAIDRLLNKGEEINYDSVTKEAKCTYGFHIFYPELKELVDSMKVKTTAPFYANARKTIEEIEKKGEKVTLAYVAHRLDCTTTKIREDSILSNIVFNQLKILLRRMRVPKDEILDAIQELKDNEKPVTFKIIADKVGLAYRTVRDKKYYNYRKIIEPHLTSHTFTKSTPFKNHKSLKNKPKANKLSKSTSRIEVEHCIKDLSEKGEKITMAKIASRLGVSHPTISKNPEFRSLVMEAGNIKARPARVNSESIKKALKILNEKGEKITYKSIASIVGCKYWTIRESPELKKIVQPFFKKRRTFTISKSQVKNTIRDIRKQGLKLSINEVCRQLECTKSYFRERPQLKKIIINAKKKDEEKLKKALQPFKDYENLSEEAQKYENIYLRYIEDMKRLGKNWKLAQNKNLSKKLNIPLEILLEIKRKYIPFTRKITKSNVIRCLLND